MVELTVRPLARPSRHRAAQDIPVPARPLGLRDFEGPFAVGEYLSVLVAQEDGGKDVGRLVDTPGSDDDEDDEGQDTVEQQVVSGLTSLLIQ